MPKAPPRKPAGVKGAFSLSKGQQQCAVGLVIFAALIGLSVLLSPGEVPETTPTKATPPTPAVMALDETSFDNFLASHPQGALVDFYATDCSFCKKLAPEYESAAKELKAANGPPLASVESSVAPALMEKYGIHRYPTVLWFWHGQNVLELPRAAEKPAAKIVEWARWAIGAAVQELDSRADFEETLATLRSTLHENGRLLVAFAGVEGMREAVEEAAQRHRTNTVFLYIKESSSDGVGLRSYAKEEANDETYEGAVAVPDVLKWVKEVLEKARPKKASPPDAEAKTEA